MTSTLGRVARFFALCWRYGVQRFKVDLAYRADFWVQMIVSLFYTGLQLFFIGALFYRIKELGGWSLEQVVLIYGFSQLSFGWFSVFCGELVQNLSDFYILEANLDRPLLRPFHPLAQLIMENLSLRDLQVVIKGTAIIIWALLHLDPPIHLSFWVLLQVQLAGLLGALIYSGVFLSTACLNFWVKDRTGLTNPLFSVGEAARYPMTIYPAAVQVFFCVLVPFAFVAFFPAAWFCDLDNWGRWLGFGPLIALASLLWAGFLFNRGLRVYESAGT